LGLLSEELRYRPVPALPVVWILKGASEGTAYTIFVAVGASSTTYAAEANVTTVVVVGGPGWVIVVVGVYVEVAILCDRQHYRLAKRRAVSCRKPYSLCYSRC
jgi:formate-dependent nitrite reductase membrane component NrfD